MGQAGSLEQRNAIRDVISLKPASATSDKERAAVASALRTFCAVFPMEEAQAATASDDSVSAGAAAAVEIKERKLFDVMHAMLQQATEQTEKKSNEELIELALTSFKRVLLWRDLYRLGAKCSMKPFLNCLLLSPALSLSVLELLLQIVGICPGSEVNEKTERWETLNRRNFSDGGGFEVLRSLLVRHSPTASATNDTASRLYRENETVLARVLELFSLTLIVRKQTTDAPTSSQAVTSLLSARIQLLSLCHHPNRSIQESAMDLVKELFQLIDLEQVHELQESAREHGALLYALSTALSQDGCGKTGSSSDASDTATRPSDGDLTPTNSRRVLQDKCMDLVELFCAGNTRSKKTVCRLFPVELFIPLENRPDLISRHTASALGKHPGGANGGAGSFERWLIEARSQGENWRSIIEAVLETHERPDLVWRSAMRDELRLALTLEIERLELQLAKDSGTTSVAVQWDHEMLVVDYPSMRKELVVHGYFIEYLVPRLADMSTQFEVAEPLVLAWHLSDRIAVEEDEHWKLMCVRCLRLVIHRAGITVLQAIIRRAKHTLLLIRPKRVFICPEFLKENYAMKVSSADTDEISNPPSSTTSSLAASSILSRNGTGANGKGSAPSSLTRGKDKKSEFKKLLNDAVGFDGCGIGTLLDTCDTAQFCAIFNSDNVRAADVLWGRRQRVMLFRYLKRTFVASSVAATNQIEEDEAVVDPDLQGSDEAIDDVFVGNIFLRSYIEGDGQFLNEWKPPMYQTLISALFYRLIELSRSKSSYNMGAELHGPRPGSLEVEPWEVQVLILKALVKLLPSHCAAVEMTTEFYDTLLLPLRRSLLGETDQILQRSPEQFVRQLQSSTDISHSTLIWTASMRSRLADTLSTELLKVKTAARASVWPRWNPDHFVAADSFRYQYPELVDELIVFDVYINNFVATPGVTLEDVDMSAFSQALLISIQSNENVLRILQQRGATDPSKERAIVVMRLALNKLVNAHPQHNLEVSPAAPATMGMTSLIEADSSDDEDGVSVVADDDELSAAESPGRPPRQYDLDRVSSMSLEDLTV
ncbi:hypothetical protein P43SY_009614 [Pythium insidiosum]|uniref:DnaJ homologue subfamily C GRV2/DNAJC13 N-terminal domain-containing protein n=1 Tax=Pythium insidiosum TaxID=114742 RepID=A0AAD5M5W0_PYTIN|nr:hypothetical protein P43SY_009614 [Pythium insidiosum]